MTDIFVHPQALCESHDIGTGTRIGAFAHVFPAATIGRDCDIRDQTVVEDGVRVGDRVTVDCGVQLSKGVRLEDDVFVGAHAMLSNDPFPPREGRLEKRLETRVCTSASIGANATILPGVTVGRGAMVSAGAVVSRDVPPN